MFTTTPTPQRSADRDWFVSWFDSLDYQRLSAHRDILEAAAFVDRLVAELRPRAAARMLDVGCGTGRHATRLASYGIAVTGIDLPPASIRLAKLNEGPTSGSSVRT